MKVSIIKNFDEVIEHQSIIDVFNTIKSDKFQSDINTYRMALAMDKDARAKELKSALLGFTPSATFTEKRKLENLHEYSTIIHLDFDNIEPHELVVLKEKVNKCPYTFASFESPSQGLKVFVKADSNKENHKIMFEAIMKHYNELTGFESDSSVKDIPRLCFFSYDPNLFLNTNSLTFNQKTMSTQDKFNSCVQFTEQKASYVNGSRNNFIHLLACNCNRSGIPHQEAESLILNNYDLESNEIIASVKSAYENNKTDFATFANIAKPANLQTPSTEEEDEEAEIDYLFTTPTLPLEHINNLPDLLREGVKAFENDSRKSDVFLTSAFCIISGCLPNVSGVYHQERVFPHLFSFIIAPAASGKGVLKNAKQLGDKIHEKLLDLNKKLKSQYEAEMLEYKLALSKRKKDDPIPEKPEEPSFKILFIPANTSQAMMMKMLMDNDGMAIICETEADAMSGTNKQDWGNYSYILRAAFHHEKISSARKTDLEFLEIKNPRIAVALSGTPKQVPKLMASAEDGLFSRFMFYAFKNETIWQDPSPKPGGIIHNDHFDMLSIKLQEIAMFLEQNPTEIFLTQNHWDKLNNAFTDKLKSVVIFTGDEAASIVYRLGLVLYRLCMVFTALRKAENGDCSKEVYCTDEDFEAALAFSDVYLQHSLLMFNNLKDKEESSAFEMPNHKRKLLDKLSFEFTRKEAIQIGVKLGLSKRSIDDFLKNSIGSLILKIKTGLYQKL